MHKVASCILGLLVAAAGVLAAIYIASLPEWFGWAKDDLRTIFSYLAAIGVFSLSPIGGGFIIYYGVTKDAKR